MSAKIWKYDFFIEVRLDYMRNSQGETESRKKKKGEERIKEVWEQRNDDLLQQNIICCSLLLVWALDNNNK